MEYNDMPKELIEINSIKNIYFIRFYDLTLFRDVERNIVVPSLLIQYDNGKLLNYTATDKYFNQFVEKVKAIYNEAKRRSQENIDEMSHYRFENIKIDDRSRKIIENTEFPVKKEITKLYEDIDSYNDSLVFPRDEFKGIIDIVRFVIKDFANYANENYAKKSITLSDNFLGSRTNFAIEGTINDIFTYFLVSCEKIDEYSYKISIGNLGGVCQPYEFELRFYDNRIDIIGKYKDSTILNEFKIDNNSCSHLNAIYRNGEKVVYEYKYLDRIDINYNNLANLDYDDNFIWYKLPWDAYYGYSGSYEKIDDNSLITTNHITYLDVNNDNFTKREYYNKKLERIKTQTQQGITLILDEFRKKTYGFLAKKYYVIETSFTKARGDGVYKDKLVDRYFYYLVKTNKLESIDRKKLIPVSKDIMHFGHDLYDEDKIKKLGGK